MYKLVLGFGLIFILSFTSVKSNDDNKNKTDSKGRIFDGEIAKPNQFKYLAYIVDKSDDTVPCMANILSSTWALTISICVDYYRKGNVHYPFEVVAGVTDRDDPNIKNTRQIVKVEDIIFHPQWTKDPLQFVFGNIALIKVDPHFVFNDYVQKIELIGTAINPLYYGEICQVASFGAIKEPDYGEEYVASRKKRFRNLTYIRNSEFESLMNRPVDPGAICAVDRKNLGLLCMKDFGAGLVCKDKLVGLAYEVFSICKKGKDHAFRFTDIRRFHNWIKNIVNSKCCPGIIRLTSGSQRLTYSCFTFILQSFIFNLLILFKNINIGS